ncbi:MAG: hypothetical protein ACR2FV_16560 [Ornithinimicrobium sp.]|uniref:hypothetical protein n=1 Tax=Ornithinimicrobium sp. TaxID=1977084 RepID=UPI003D9BD5CB
MPPSSLIFVVILAVWAAYLIQHWVRRRDHIATARSVDRFSEAMRVLERRQRGPRVDLSTPTPRSYAVSPARPAHPEVVVKRAQASAADDPADTAPASSPARAVTAPLLGARGRGTTLLLASMAMVLGTALGVLEVWPLWTVAAGIAVFALTLALVRTSARRSTETLPRPLRRPDPARGTSGPDDTTPATAPGPRSAPTRSVVTAAGGAAAALAARDGSRGDPVGPQAPVASAAPRRRPAGTVLYDIDAIESRHRADSSGPRVDPAAATPGSWQPIPVPPPTYTLKAKASSPHTGSTAMPTSQATASQDLPFDGYALALEEESEDLPAVHSLS